MLQVRHRSGESGRPRELGILGQQRLCGGARGDDGLLVAEHAQGTETGPEAALRTTQHVALATLLEVDPAELETVRRGGHSVEPVPGRRTRLGPRDQQAQPGQAASAYPATQLVELGDPEPVS